MTILDQIEDRLYENHGHAFLYQYILSLSKHVPYFKSAMDGGYESIIRPS